MMLVGKIAVITGASSGIGAETAKLLSRHGAMTVLAARSEDKLRRVAAQLDGPYDLCVMDVASDESVRAGMAAIREKHGPVDILINNAGFGRFERFARLDLPEFQRMMDVNFFGMVRCTQAVLPDMLARGSGHIVNIASLAGKISTPKSTAYAATKRAVLGFTDSLRQELRGTGIAVSAVNPGPVATPFFEIADPDGAYLDRLPRWFVLQPQEAAEAVLKVIRTRRAELDIPRIAGLAVKLAALMPRLTDRIAGPLLNKK
jgi:hypothetical protein